VFVEYQAGSAPAEPNCTNGCGNYVQAAFLQPVAMGVLLGQGWHVYSKVVAHGSFVGIGLCSSGVVIGVIAGTVLSKAAPHPSQAALRLSLFWISCTVNGGLSAIAQLRLRVGRSQANDDALIVNSFLSSGLLGISLPHVVLKVAKRPEAEVVMPCILAVLLTEAICSSETMPVLQVGVATFLLAVGIQGIANDSNSDNESSSKGGASGGSDSSRSEGTTPVHEPFFPATVMASQRYSPHFLVGRRTSCVPSDISGVVPLVSLVPRQAVAETPRVGGKGKDRGQRSTRQRLMEDPVITATTTALAAGPPTAASASSVPPAPSSEPAAAAPVEIPSGNESKKALQQNANVGSDIRWDVVYEEMKRVDNGKITKVAEVCPPPDGPVEVFAQLAVEGDVDDDEGWPCDVDVTHVPLGDPDLGDNVIMGGEVSEEHGIGHSHFACDEVVQVNGLNSDATAHKHTREIAKVDGSGLHHGATTTAPRGATASEKSPLWERPQQMAAPALLAASQEWHTTQDLGIVAHQPPTPWQQQQQLQQLQQQQRQEEDEEEKEEDLAKGDAALVVADAASTRESRTAEGVVIGAEVDAVTSCLERPLPCWGTTLAEDPAASLQEAQSAGNASLRAGAEAFVPVDSVPAEALVETAGKMVVPESPSIPGSDPSARPKLRADAKAFFPTGGLLAKAFHSSVPAASKDTTLTADASATKGTSVVENGAAPMPGRMEFFPETTSNDLGSGNAADPASSADPCSGGEHEYHWTGSAHRMADDWSAPFGPDTAHVVSVADDKKPFNNGSYGYNGDTWDSYAQYNARHAWDNYGPYGDDGTGMVQSGYGYGADGNVVAADGMAMDNEQQAASTAFQPLHGSDFDAGTWAGAGHNSDQAQGRLGQAQAEVEDARQATETESSDTVKKDTMEPITSLIDPELPDPGPGRASDVRRGDVFEPSVASSKSVIGGDSNARTLWVGDLETWMAEDYISDLFADVALVTNVSIIRERGGREAFVEFASHNAALGVLESLGGQPITAKDGRKLPVNWAEQQHVEEALPTHEDGRGDVHGDRRRQERERVSQRVTERHMRAPASEAETQGRYSRDGRHYGGTSGDASGTGYSWAYVDPNGEVQVGFTMEEMRKWFKIGYFDGDMKLALIRGNHAQAKAPPAREFYPLKQWFPDATRSFTYVPRF